MPSLLITISTGAIAGLGRVSSTRLLVCIAETLASTSNSSRSHSGGHHGLAVGLDGDALENNRCR